MIKRQISQLYGQAFDTTTAKNHINTLLRNSDFQGFRLAEKKDAPNVYEVVRENGEVVKDISEGEKNFLAFLYFYYLTIGSNCAEGETRSKIVVIDDPVSSMDSKTLFIVGSLVKEMIETCRNNADNRNMIVPTKHIKQIFILTHNAYFHQEITYRYISRYSYTSFYLVNKLGNKSSITPCEAPNPASPTEMININPVKTPYVALWDEYKQLSAIADNGITAIPVINVIHRILEHYFMQTCCYDGMTLRQTILDKNRKRFQDEKGNYDPDKFHIASSILSYITAMSNQLSDGLNYIDGTVSAKACTDVFEMIFDIMGQKQHYDKMMGMASS